MLAVDQHIGAVVVMHTVLVDEVVAIGVDGFDVVLVVTDEGPGRIGQRCDLDHLFRLDDGCFDLFGLGRATGGKGCGTGNNDKLLHRIEFPRT